jgi:hypothetical protein
LKIGTLGDCLKTGSEKEIFRVFSDAFENRSQAFDAGTVY